MRRALKIGAIALLLNIVATACILDADGFTSGNGQVEAGAEAGQEGSTNEGGNTPQGDGSSSDLDSGANNGDAGSESGAGPNLLTNPGFEIGCASWHVDFGTIEEFGSARTGVHSCKFCRGGNFEAFFSQEIEVPAPKDSEWFAEAWLRVEEDAASLPDSTNLMIESTYSGGDYKGPVSIGPPLNKTWQRVTALMKPPIDGDKVGFILRIQNGEPCVLVDDVTLNRTK